MKHRDFAAIDADIAALRRPQHPCTFGVITPAAIDTWRKALAEWRQGLPDGDARYEALLVERDATEAAMAAARRMDAQLDKLNLPERVRATLRAGRRTPLFDEADAWLAQQGKTHLVLSGPSGVGKSVAAAYGLFRQLRAGARVQWQNAASLVREVGSAFDADSQRRLLVAQNVQCLALDDLGAEHRSDFSSSVLFEVLQHRHEEGLRTIITTNLGVDAFRERVGSRLYDRIRSACVWTMADGQSLRGRAA